MTTSDCSMRYCLLTVGIFHLREEVPVLKELAFTLRQMGDLF